jgi:predicted enzyme related to lactoylglutathione lyase
LTSTNGQGTFVWHDHYGLDLDSAPRFYSGLMGWTVSRCDLGADGVYPLASANGESVAGFLSFEGVAAHWSGYLRVENYDEVEARWRQAGGTVRFRLGDVPDFGRVGLLSDPWGVEVALIQPVVPRDTSARKVGRFACATLEVEDLRGAEQFWRSTLGLALRPAGSDGHPTLCAGDAEVARIVVRDAPASLVHNLVVSDPTAALARALELGATDAGRGPDGVRRIVDPDGGIVGLSPASRRVTPSGEPADR